MAPKEKDNSNTLLFHDGKSWDLSNLVQKGQATRVEQPQDKSVSKYRPRRQRIPEESLYPNPNELQDSKFDFLPAAEAFRKAPVKAPTSQPGAFHAAPGSWIPSNSSHRPTQRRPSSTQTSPTTLPGAFPSSNTTTRPKPPLPSWVEEPNELAKKLKGKCVIDESSSSRTESTYSRSSTSSSSEDPYVNIYRQESMRSMQSTGSVGPVAREKEDESTPPTTSTFACRSQIEVAPGVYMPLRGSTETLAAVESGMARTVSCIACQATLRCVPDAQLVICPDCRLLSPLEQENHDRSRIKSQPGVQYQIGGVGLGLKVDAGGR